MIRLSIFKKMKKDTKCVESIERNPFKQSEHDSDEGEGLEEFANSEMSIYNIFHLLIN